MNKIQFFFCCTISLLVFLQSCNIEKRRYVSGYYISNHKRSALKTSFHKVNHNAIPVAEIKRQIEIAALKKEDAKKNLTASTEKKKQLTFNFQPLILPVPGDTCDTLVLRSGVEIKAWVLEISSKIIRYKHCDDPDGPTYTMDLQEVASIRYKNGTRDEFKEEPRHVINTGPGGSPRSSVPISEEEKIRKKANATLAFGLLSFPLLIIYFAGIAFAIVAIASAVSLKKLMKREPQLYSQSAMRKANAGMILGIVLLSLLLITIILLIAALAGLLLFWI